MYVFLFNKHDKINIDFKKQYSLFESLELLRKWNKKAILSNTKTFVTYSILDEVSGEAVLVDKMPIGTTHSIDFFELTQNRLRSLYTEEELQDHLTLLDSIEAQYQSEKDDFYANKSLGINEELLKKTMPSSSTEVPESKPNESIKGNKQSFDPKEEKKAEKKKPFVLIKEMNKKGIVALSIITFIVIMGSSFFLFRNTNVDHSKEDFTNFIEKEQYAQALEAYPQKYPEIEQAIVSQGEKGIPYLEEFIQQNDYAQAEFDLAYLKKDYKKVIELETLADTDMRKAYLVMAFIYQDNLEKAHEFNQVIHDAELNTLIDETYYYLILESLKKSDIEQAKKYQVYANNSRINDLIQSYLAVETDLQSLAELSEKEQSGIFKKKKAVKLADQKSKLLNQEFKSVENSNPFFLIALFIIAVIAAVIYLFSRKNAPKDEKRVTKSNTFNELIENNLYLEALKKFPQRYPEIEREIFRLGETGIPYLQEFLKKKQYKPGEFDLSYLKKDYEEVIQLEKYADTDARKAQLVIAYIQTGQIEQANEINQYIQVTELSHYLKEHYYQLTVEALKNEDYKLAQTYQEKGNSTDIDYLIGTIKMIDEKIQAIERTQGNPLEDPKDKYRLRKLKEARGVSLNLS